MRTHPPLAPTNLLAAAAVACALSALLVLSTGADRTLFLRVNHALQIVPDPLLGALALLGLGLSALLLLSPALVIAPRLLGAALFAAPIGLVLTHIPKDLMHVPRPLAVLDAAQVHVVGVALRGANALPSGHAVTALALATILVLGSAWLASSRWRTAAVLALAATLCAARIAVGAHWPSDVLAGAALGVATGWLALRAADRWPLWQYAWGQGLLAVLVFGCAVAMALQPAELPQLEPLRALLALTGIASVAAWTAMSLRMWLATALTDRFGVRPPPRR